MKKEKEIKSWIQTDTISFSAIVVKSVNNHAENEWIMLRQRTHHIML